MEMNAAPPQANNSSKNTNSIPLYDPFSTGFTSTNTEHVETPVSQSETIQAPEALENMNHYQRALTVAQALTGASSTLITETCTDVDPFSAQKTVSTTPLFKAILGDKDARNGVIIALQVKADKDPSLNSLVAEATNLFKKAEDLQTAYNEDQFVNKQDDTTFTKNAFTDTASQMTQDAVAREEVKKMKKEETAQANASNEAKNTIKTLASTLPSLFKSLESALKSSNLSEVDALLKQIENVVSTIYNQARGANNALKLLSSIEASLKTPINQGRTLASNQTGLHATAGVTNRSEQAAPAA